MSEEEIRRMERAHRTAGRPDRLTARLPAHHGDQLADQIAVVGVVALGSLLDRGACIGPALPVDAIRAVQRDPARVDERRHRIDHAPSLPVPHSAVHGGKGDDRLADQVAVRVAIRGVDAAFEVVAERLTVGEATLGSHRRARTASTATGARRTRLEAPLGDGAFSWMANAAATSLASSGSRRM